MMSTNVEKNREQVQFICMDDLVPKDHLLRLIDGAIEWSFIYDLVEDKYSQDNGRPSLDPDSGWFHKGEHKQVFAYSVETACDIRRCMEKPECR